MKTEDKIFLKKAIELATKSVEKGGFPAGALVVKDGKIVSKGISIGFLLNDPTAHAETAAIRQACQNLNTHDLTGATLYESLECCTMCFSVANWSGISKIVYAGRKTVDMVRKGYYEGITDNNDLNRKNSRKIELVHISALEKDSLAAIIKWEESNAKS